MPLLKRWLNPLKRQRSWKSTLEKEIARNLRKTALASPEDVNTLFKMLTPWDCKRPYIRVGGDNDGGYLMINDFEGVKASFSPGVAETVEFDLEIAERGIQCFLIDASIEGITTKHELISFERLFLGPKTEGNTISLDDWVARHAPESGDLLLQIDIEGAEYDCLLAASDETLARFRQIVIEFHEFDMAFSAAGNAKLQRLFGKLNALFTLCHLHENNFFPVVSYADYDFPLLFEATYLRKDRHAPDLSEASLPHPLDQPCVTDKPESYVPPIWNTPFEGPPSSWFTRLFQR